jgi:hypothetical protein
VHQPVRHVPFASRDVRSRVPAEKRPRSASGKPISNAQLTKELNKAEKQLNAHGYSLRDTTQATTIHEHRPSRAVLEKQEQQIESVIAKEKPARAPLTPAQLRNQVRRATKPPPARRAGSTTHQYSVQSPASAASVSFDWRPSLGEGVVASVYLDTRANFTGGGLGPMKGSFVTRAGAVVMGQRYDALRLDAEFASANGAYQASVKVTWGDGFEIPLYEVQQEKNLDVERRQPLFDYGAHYSTTLPILGYPITVDLALTPTVHIDYGAYLADDMLWGYAYPDLQVELTAEAYLSAFIVRAGASGKVTLLDVKPSLAGALYFDNEDGQAKPFAQLHGSVRTVFLRGSLDAFVEVFALFGWKRFSLELVNYSGWSYDVPVFRYDSAG